MRLTDRVAIVTGSAQGIGLAIAERLATDGARVMIADVNGPGAEAAAARIPGAVWLEVDVSAQEDVDRLLDETLRRLGKVDILVNNAAITPYAAWNDIDLDSWRQVMAVNLDGVFLTCQAASRVMREKRYGRIINIVSNTILAGTPNMAHYVASKGGVLALTRALATELGPFGITANSVAPGLTETEGVNASLHSGAFDVVQSLQAIPRRAVPGDIAPVVAFLASEEARWVTGSMVLVDGGHTRH